MNMKKRLIAFLLVLVMTSTLGLQALPVHAADYFPRYDGNSPSIVDALQSVGAPSSSFDYRCDVAEANGVHNYQGSGSQNMELLSLLKAGKLRVPGSGTVSPSSGTPSNSGCYPAYSGGESIVDALRAIGVEDTSFNYRERIAQSNGIRNYQGSVEQNRELLSRLASGTLRRPESGSVTVATSSSSTVTSSVQAHKDGSKLVEVKKDNAPLRSSPSKDGEVIVRCAKGVVLEVDGSKYNLHLRKWYQVQWDGETCYIYSGNVTAHKHSYEEMTLDDVTYGVCGCGNITVSSSEAKSTEGAEVSKAAALAMPAAALAMADGPIIPVGDIIALGLLIAGSVYAYKQAAPAVDEIVGTITDIDFDEYLAARRYNICSEYTFRRVARVGGQLKFLDNQCLNQIEAYIYVVALNGDVYTYSEDAALFLAAMHGSAIMERDKDKATYYYHYHLGTDRQLKGHIFFGVNDFGETPT